MPTNITQDYIDQLLTIMIDDNLIHNKPTPKGPSYFITKHQINNTTQDPVIPHVIIEETQLDDNDISTNIPTADKPFKINEIPCAEDPFISLQKIFMLQKI